MYRIIFEHHPKEGQEEKFIEEWQKGSDIIQTYPGARGTKLFRDVKNPKVLYASAEWESKAARSAIMPEIDARMKAEGKYNLHEQYVDEVKVFAEMELIAESLPPKSE